MISVRDFEGLQWGWRDLTVKYRPRITLSEAIHIQYHDFWTMTTDKDKSFDCTLCPRSFARLEHLQRHRRSHTKEKPFQCPMCSHAFTRSDLLLRHKRLAHSAAIPTNGPTHSPPSASSTSTFLGLGEEEQPTSPSRSDTYRQLVTSEATYRRSSTKTSLNGQ